jgi:hypothetical protein
LIGRDKKFTTVCNGVAIKCSTKNICIDPVNLPNQQLRPIYRGGNRAGRIGFWFGWVGSGKFDQKNYRVTGRVRINLIWVGSGKFDQKNYRITGRVRINLIRVGSGFWSNIVGLFRISDHFGSDRVSIC